MSTLQEYISVIGCFQGCLLFGLLVFDSRLHAASRILGVMCLLVASVFALPFLFAAPAGSWVLKAVGWVFYVPAASGALAFLYCRSALLDQPLRLSDWVFFTPWILCYLLVADLLFANPAEMAAWAQGAAPQTWRLQASEYLLFVQALGYAGLTILMIWRYRRQANDTLANFNPMVFRWFLTLQVFTIAVWLLKALPALTSAPVVYSEVANLLLVLFVYFIALTQWRNPQLFTIPSLGSEQAAASLDRVPRVPAETDGELDPAMRAQLFDALKNQVERDMLYLDSALTLSSLAEATGLNKYHLSEALNRHAGQNFYEFINGYRIAFVCERLTEDRERKVLDIALDAGFSSKSTFNAIFKQFKGQTPTEYRRTLAPQVV